MKRIVSSIVLFLFMSITGFTQDIPSDSLYLGQSAPGESPLLFAPGIVSRTDRFDHAITFHSNGQECYFSSSDMATNTSQIFHSEYMDSHWSSPTITSFSEDKDLSQPIFSKQEDRLYFNSYESGGTNLYYIEKESDEWSDPKLFPEPINSNFSDGDFFEVSDSLAYFTSTRSGGSQDWGDIWCAQKNNDQTWKVEKLEYGISSNSTEFAPCLPADGSYMIITSDRGGGYGEQDLYVSFKKEDNTWTSPINMEKTGAGINIPGWHQTNPSLSPDEKYLFFSRHDPYPFETWNIYWISTSIITELKEIAFRTAIDEVRQSQLLIYPNPAKNNLYVDLNNSDLSNCCFELVSISGVTMLNGNLKSNSIDISKLKTGIYFLQVISDTEIITKQFIVE